MPRAEAFVIPTGSMAPTLMGRHKEVVCPSCGYTYAITPISWRNRKFGVAKLKIKEMGSRYFFICAYVWLEKYFSRGDYRRK